MTTRTALLLIAVTVAALIGCLISFFVLTAIADAALLRLVAELLDAAPPR